MEAPIPLFWGKQLLKNAEMMLDPLNNRVRIKGMWVDLVVSDCDYYGIKILPKRDNVEQEVGVKEGYSEQDCCKLTESKELEDGKNYDGANNNGGVVSEEVDGVHTKLDKVEDDEVDQGDKDVSGFGDKMNGGEVDNNNDGMVFEKVDGVYSRMDKEVRVVEGQVYYKEKNGWLGPATLIGKYGSVYYLRHQSLLLRVVSRRMIGIGKIKIKEDGIQSECGVVPDSGAGDDVWEA